MKATFRTHIARVFGIGRIKRRKTFSVARNRDGTAACESTRGRGRGARKRKRGRKRTRTQRLTESGEERRGNAKKKRPKCVGDREGNIGPKPEESERKRMREGERERDTCVDSEREKREQELEIKHRARRRARSGGEWELTRTSERDDGREEERGPEDAPRPVLLPQSSFGGDQSGTCGRSVASRKRNEARNGRRAGRIESL